MTEIFHFGEEGRMYVHGMEVLLASRAQDELVGRIVRFLVDAGCEPAVAMMEIEFGRPPSESE